MFDVGVRGGATNAVVAAAIVAIVVALLTDRRVERTQARWVAAAAVVPVPFLARRAQPMARGVRPGRDRSAPWRGRVVRGVGFAPRHDTGPGGAAPGRGNHAIVVGASVVAGGAPVARPSPDPSCAEGRGAVRDRVAGARARRRLARVRRRRLRRHRRAARQCRAGTRPPRARCALHGRRPLRRRGRGGDVDDAAHRGRFAALEMVTMLTLAAAVLGVFVISQLVALTDAGHRLVGSSGLTPAEYGGQWLLPALLGDRDPRHVPRGRARPRGSGRALPSRGATPRRARPPRWRSGSSL